MPRIRPVGGFWPLDAEGFIENDAAPGKIHARHAPLVSGVVDAYREHLGSHVHGIYVRGTVARGAAIDGVSDLDDFVLVDSGGLDLSWRNDAARRLVARHPHVTGVGMDLVTPDEVGGTDRFSELALQMVTQTACVWGENVIPRLPKYRPGVLVANNDVVQIGADIEEAVPELAGGISPDNARYWCRRIAKNIVRAGFSLTILDDRRYTRDLYPCYTSFASAYPERDGDMRRALEYALAPTSDVEEALAFLDGFGSWLVERAESWLDRHNPSGELALRLDLFPEEVRFPG